METENNVVTINGQEYIEDNLNEGQKVSYKSGT